MSKRPTCTVIVEGDRFRGEITRILEVYATHFKRDMVFHRSDDYHAEPVNDGRIHVFSCCTPAKSEEDVDEVEIKQLFGINLEDQDASHAPSPIRKRTDSIRFKDEEGVAFGEACGKNKNNFYFYPRIGYTSWSATDELLLVEMLNRYFSKISGTIAPIRRMWQKAETERQKIGREEYISLCSGRLTREIENLGAGIRTAEESISLFSKKLTENYRELDVLKARLDSGIKDRETLLREFGREYDRFRQNANVEKVLAQGNKVVVFTKTLILQKRRIGKFKISMTVGDGDYTIENIDGSVNGYDHPHVAKDGSTCLGSYEHEICEQIAAYQFALAFHLIWRRLNVYTPSNPYQNIESWPMAGGKKR